MLTMSTNEHTLEFDHPQLLHISKPFSTLYLNLVYYLNFHMNANTNVAIGDEQYQQVVTDLTQAFALGQVSEDVFRVAATAIGERGVNVVGAVNGTVVTGDNNIVINLDAPPEGTTADQIQWLVTHLSSYQSHALSPKTTATDETVLLANAMVAYEATWRNDVALVDSQPYRGLHEFRPQDRRYFFGREMVVADLVQEIQKRPSLIWLHGRSGTGKTSLIQAGLIPALLPTPILPIYVRLIENTPTIALQKAVLQDDWSAQLDLARDSLSMFLRQISDWSDKRPFVVIFDQFEEFYINLTPQQREQFAAELATCLQADVPDICFIFSLRSEYFGRTSFIREQLTHLPNREFYLQSLTTSQAQQAIIKPIEPFQITYQSGLVEHLIADLAQEDISPQLQLVCKSLYDTLPEGTTEIAFDHYNTLGTAQGILENYLKQVITDNNRIAPRQQKAVRYILTTLVSPEGHRTRKQLAQWYNDATLQRLAINWYFTQNGLTGVGTPLEQTTLQHLALDVYLSRIKAHTSSLTEPVLKLMLQETLSSTTAAFVNEICQNFIHTVIQTLSNNRLINTVSIAPDTLAYELVHDYLTAEIYSWLDEDGKVARQVQRMLAQKQHDYEQHRLLLSKEELAIVATQLDNPQLNLTEQDKKIALISAVTQQDAQLWLTISKENGRTWLREAIFDQKLSKTTRLRAAIYLGTQADSLTFTQLRQQTNQQNIPRIYHNLPAHYVHQTPRPLILPPKLQLAIFPHLARLRLRQSLPYQIRIWFISIIGALIASSYLSIKDLAIGDNIILVILTGILFGGTALPFSPIVTALAVISVRWRWWWALLLLSLGGGITGNIFYSFLGAWYAGFIVGAVVAIGQRLSLSPTKRVLFAMLINLVLGSVALGINMVFEEAKIELEAITIFNGLFIYAASASPFTFNITQRLSMR